MAEHSIGVFIIFTSLDGKFPPPDEIAQVVKNALLLKYPPDRVADQFSIQYDSPPTTPLPLVKRWRVKTPAANVRIGPGTQYAVAVALPYGTIITEERSENGWIKYTAGWVSSNILEAL
jgi:hypothetical protein